MDEVINYNRNYKDILYYLAFYNNLKDPDKALEFLQEYEKQRQEYNTEEEKSISEDYIFFLYAQIYKKQEHLEEAYKYNKKISEKFSQYNAILLELLSYCKNTKNLVEYLEHYQKIPLKNPKMTEDYVQICIELIQENKESCLTLFETYFNNNTTFSDTTNLRYLFFKSFLLYKIEKYQEVVSIFKESIFPQVSERILPIEYPQEYDLYLYSFYKTNELEQSRHKTIEYIMNGSYKQMLSIMNIYILDILYQELHTYLYYLYHLTYYERKKYYENTNNQYNLFMLTKIHESIITKQSMESINEDSKNPLTSMHTYNEFSKSAIFFKILYIDSKNTRDYQNIDNSINYTIINIESTPGNFCYVYCIEQILNQFTTQNTITCSTSNLSTETLAKEHINNLRYGVEINREQEENQLSPWEKLFERSATNRSE